MAFSLKISYLGKCHLIHWMIQAIFPSNLSNIPAIKKNSWYKHEKNGEEKNTINLFHWRLKTAEKVIIPSIYIQIFPRKQWTHLYIHTTKGQKCSFSKNYRKKETLVGFV